jgi:hypothetical protein
MRAVILAPGPSLSRLAAVNRAILRFPHAHVWAASDYPTIKYHHAASSAVQLLTRSQTWVDVQRFPAVAAMGVAIVEDLSVPVAGWSNYTATSALGFLRTIGAARVDVYGADMHGTVDYDGKEAGENRGAERWAAERDIWGRLVAWMVGMGCEVVRHTAGRGETR